MIELWAVGGKGARDTAGRLSGTSTYVTYKVSVKYGHVMSDEPNCRSLRAANLQRFRFSRHAITFLQEHDSLASTSLHGPREHFFAMQIQA